MRVGGNSGGKAAKVDGNRFMSEGGGGTAQVTDVPAVASRENGQAHRHQVPPKNERRSTSGSNRPKR